MAKQTKKQEINFLFPKPGDRRPTLVEFQEHIAKAERSENLTFAQHKKRIDEWIKAREEGK